LGLENAILIFSKLNEANISLRDILTGPTAIPKRIKRMDEIKRGISFFMFSLDYLSKLFLKSLTYEFNKA